MTNQAQERATRLAALPFQTSEANTSSHVGAFFRSIKEIVAHRELLDLLIRRELKARYKDSSLGFLWSLIKPITMLLIYYVAIGQFLGAARGIPEFAIFVFSGLTLWGLFSEIIAGGTSSIVGNAGLIKKVYLPREIFPLAAAGSALFNFAIQFAVLLIATIALGDIPWTPSIGYVPAGVAVALIYGIALALLLSALNVYLRDIQYLVEVGLLLFFWASPIVYSYAYVVDAAQRTGNLWIAEIYLWNPITIAMLAFQRGMWVAGSRDNVMGQDAAGADIIVRAQAWPENLDLRLLGAAVVGLVLVWAFQRVFSRLQGNFAQEI
ncbi:MAG: sugar transporter [Microbacteriaceae bacterium]|jgi:ABC-2 type transport system permease protein|nr:sugar transporter [Microbacteriaceae bacterium]